jgi:SAM-dependent methyltransferase
MNLSMTRKISSVPRQSIDYQALERENSSMPPDGWGQQCWYIEQLLKTGHIDRLDTVLHIGSAAHNPERLYGNSYKPLFQKYGHQGSIVGVDCVPGDNVDEVIDFSSSYEPLITKFPNKFDLIICTSMLEHDREPTKTIRYVSALLRPQGKVIFTAPCTQRIHGNVGTYGNYQNLLPDFFYHHCRQSGLQIMDGSFIYMTVKGEMYRVDGVNHHENIIYENETDEPYYGFVDKRNIPRIKSLSGYLRSSPFPRNLMVRVMTRLFTKVSPEFGRLLKQETVYLTAQMALFCVKRE